jgi:hypothetical protein
MNEQKFDKIFRDKLSGYSKEPAAEAFEKLESRFATKNRRARAQFSKLAATLLLVAISVYTVNRWNNESEKRESNISVLEPNNSDDFTSDIARISTPESENIASSRPEVHTVEPQISEEKEEIPTVSLLTSNAKTEKLQEPAGTIDALAQAKESPPALLEAPMDQEQTIETSGPEQPSTHKVTITYKKSPEPPNPMLALQKEQSNNGRRLKRIWKSITPGDISLAGIRATKDQLLAVNKKNKKKEPESRSKSN